jgi:hypothetical protein
VRTLVVLLLGKLPKAMFLVSYAFLKKKLIEE